MFSGGIIAIIAIFIGMIVGFLIGLYIGLDIKKKSDEIQKNQAKLTTLRVDVASPEIHANPEAIKNTQLKNRKRPWGIQHPWGKPRIFVDDRVTGFSFPRSSENLILKIKREED